MFLDLQCSCIHTPFCKFIHKIFIHISHPFQKFQFILMNNDYNTTGQLLLNDKKIVSLIRRYLKRPGVDVSNGDHSVVESWQPRLQFQIGDVTYQYDENEEPSKVLEPLLELVVSLASDIPQQFYKSHLFKLLPRLVSHVFITNAPQINRVFNGIIGIFFLLKNQIAKGDSKKVLLTIMDLYNLVFSDLLSSRRSWYISNFAAQTFACVINNNSKLKFESFFKKIFKTLDKNSENLPGVGKLITAVMKGGILNQLHDDTPKVLQSILSAMVRRDLFQNKNVVLECLLVGLTGLALFITKANPNKEIPWDTYWTTGNDHVKVWAPIWESLENIMSGKYADHSKFIDLNDQYLSILEVIKFLCNFNNGALIIDIRPVYESLKKIIADSSEAVGALVMDISFDAFNSRQRQLSSVKYPNQINRNSFFDMLLESPYSHSLKLSFLKKTVLLPAFKDKLQQKVINCLNVTVLDSDNPELQAQSVSVLLDIVIHHRHPIKSLEERSTWCPYKVHIPSGQGIPGYIKDVISRGLDGDLANLEMLTKCLLLAPHIQEMSIAESADQFKPILIAINRALFQKTVSSSYCNKLIFFLGIVVELLVVSVSNDKFLSMFRSVNVFGIMKNHPELRMNPHLLRVIDFQLMIFSETSVDDRHKKSENLLSEENFLKLYELISPCLASPKSLIRLLSSHILSLFPLALLSTPEGCTNTSKGMFKRMYDVESCALDPYNFKDRIRLMALIDTEHIAHEKPASGKCDEAPLLFAFGQLYVNFSSIWTHVQNFIAKYAQTMDTEVFWPLWCQQLEAVEKGLLLGPDAPEVKFFEDSTLNNIYEYLETHDASANLSSKVDHLNVRDMMFRTMLNFPTICQKNSDYIVKSFEAFLKHEFKLARYYIAPTENLRKVEAPGVDEQEADEDPGVEEEEVEEEEETEETEVEGKSYGKSTFSTLCNYLQLLSSFSNLKQIDAKKTIENILMDLILHSNNVIRGYALQCIFAYNYKYLTPYKEIVMEIHGNGTFVKGVSSFHIGITSDEDENTSSIHIKHRKNFMAFYIRFLYGRMQGNLGKNTEGKKKSHIRKAIITRVLAGITEEESEVLFSLAFEIILPHMKGSTLDVVLRILDGVDTSNSIPLKRLHGVLVFLENILNHLGNLLTSKQPFFLKIILMVLSYHSVIRNKHGSEIHHRFTNTLKKINTFGRSLLLIFFDTFDKYQWTSDEIDALFHAAVWPWIDKLVAEGFLNIHPLLKLFGKFADHDRLHPLLVKHHPSDKSLYPLSVMFKLTSSPKCSFAVRKYIFEIVYNLMGLVDNVRYKDLADAKEGSKSKKVQSNGDLSADAAPVQKLIHCTDLLPIPEPETRIQGTVPTYGTKMLLLHMTELSEWMLSIKKLLIRKSYSADQHLQILCEITKYSIKPVHADEFLTFITSVLAKRKVSDGDAITYLLQVCAHLIPTSLRLEHFCTKFIRLFHILTGRENRTALCNIFDQVNEVSDKYLLISKYMKGFNSFQKGVTVTIDSGRRLQTYIEAIELLQSHSDYDAILFEFLIAQCSHDMKAITDVKLLEGCERCFKEIIVTLRKFKDSHTIEFKACMEAILTIAKKAFGSISDSVHCICFKLLKVMVDEVGSDLRSLGDLCNLLTFDPKFDFFRVISDIQMIRRAQAISYIANSLRTGSLVLSNETIENFLWPLMRRYLTHNDYAEEVKLQLAAVDCTGYLASRLPWKIYSVILKYFLGKMASDTSNKSVCLMVVNAILNAFHEDVSGLSVELKTERMMSDGKLNRPRAEELMELDEYNVLNKEDLEKLKAATKAESLGGNQLKGEDHVIDVYNFFMKQIMPDLKKVFESRSEEANKHKSNKSKNDDAIREDMKRIPLALPLVKILKKFPTDILDAHISNIFYQVIAFLKSRKHTIRKQAADTLVTVFIEAGGKYLQCLLYDLSISLQGGFRKFVHMNVVKRVLEDCSEVIADHISPCIDSIMSLCISELFSQKQESDIIRCC